MEPTAILAAIALVPQPAELAATGGTAPAAAEVRYVEDASIPAEGYRLSVAEDGIRIASSDEAGRFYAGVTLRQLALPDGSLPCVEIADAPAFAWRGMHLDVSRHFFGVDDVKRFLDLMAAHKLNRFHWHLTDSQGWRLDVPSHPELAAASARRNGRKDEAGEPFAQGDHFYYTEEDVRDVLAYAAARHIEVVPEIEMPGHFGAVLSAHPEFACVDGDGNRIGWNEICAGNDAALACMEDVLDDVCRLFPFGAVHIGGDECSRKKWMECPRCQARIEAEGLADEDALQNWISRRMVRFLESRGKRALGWDEFLLGGGVSTNAIGMRWRGAGGAGGGPSNFVSAATMAAAGHDLVMASSRWVYLDYPQGLPDDPCRYTFDKQKPLDLCYAFDPLRDIPPELHGRVLGGEGCNWTETTPTREILEWKMWPRACALAECLWCGAGRKPSYEDFLRRLEVHRARLVADGVNAAPIPSLRPAALEASSQRDHLADRYAGGIRFGEDGRERPAVSNGTFRLGGRPVFFVGPWIYNDTRKDWPPENPDPQGVGHFAYREPPGKDVFERVGFNASQLSAAWSLPGQALFGLDVPEDWRGQEEEKAAFFGRFGDQPMVVDFAFGFAGALKRQRPELAREIDQRTPHWHEFVPFCPESPDGDRYYRAYLKGGAVSALRGGANVFLWELFNESSYQCRCPSNAVAFAKEMEAAFGTIDAANRAWGTGYADFGAVAAETDFFRHARLWPDYAKFLARRYAAILSGYAEFIRSIDARGNVYFTEQSSVSSIEKERDACMDYRLVADALDVLAYEGGFPFGRSGAEIVGASEMEDVVFDKAPGHFFDLDFYRALARRGRKPMVNDELYCQRIESGLRVPSRREDLATVLWAELFHGSSGAFAYCWAKRAWEWKDLDGARRMVEKPSYKSAHLLNPYAWPPEALDGFRLFRDELDPFRDRILDVPRTRSDEVPSVAVVFSYPTVRMLGHVRMDYRERLQRWYGAVLGAHYPVQVVFEEDLTAGLPPSVRALVVPSARFATPEGAAAANRLAESGLTVIADNDAFLSDERGDPLPAPSAKIVRLDADSDASVAPLLAALAASGARRDATLALEGSGRPPHGSDIEVVDRGDFKLLFFVAFGEDATQGGILRWNIADEGAFYLSDPIHGRLLLNGSKDTWDAAALSNGVFVAVPPQERALFALSRKPPSDSLQARSADFTPRSGDLPARSADFTRIDEPAMRAIVDADRAREAPELAEFARRAAEAAAAHDAARRWPDVDAARCTPVPIAGSANMAFADEVAGDGRGGWFDQGSNDFATMPLGRHVLAGVPFEIADPATNGGRAAIVLFGTNREFFPERAPEIPVGRKARRLYFLHGYGWDETPGATVLTYRIRYADGETVDFVCRAKAEIGPWHGSFVPSDAKLAVESSNPVLGTVNVQCARWENPRPDVEILGIEPVSARSAAVPAVVAITAER